MGENQQKIRWYLVAQTYQYWQGNSIQTRRVEHETKGRGRKNSHNRDWGGNANALRKCFKFQ